MFAPITQVRPFKSPFWRDWLFWLVATGVSIQITVAVVELDGWANDHHLVFFAYFLVWVVVAFFRAADDATHL